MHRLLSLSNRERIGGHQKMSQEDYERSEDHLVFEDLVAIVKEDYHEERV